MPWVVHGEKWVKLVNDAVLGNKMIGVLTLRTKKEDGDNTVSAQDFYDIGVVGRISRLLKLPEDAIQIFARPHGKDRGRVLSESRDIFSTINTFLEVRFGFSA